MISLAAATRRTIITVATASLDVSRGLVSIGAFPRRHSSHPNCAPGPRRPLFGQWVCRIRTPHVASVCVNILHLPSCLSRLASPAIKSNHGPDPNSRHILLLNGSFLEVAHGHRVAIYARIFLLSCCNAISAVPNNIVSNTAGLASFLARS